MVEESPAARRADGFCGDAAIYPKGTAKARSPGAAGAPLKRREVASNPRPLRSVTRSPKRGAGSGVLPATNIAQGKRPPSACFGRFRGWPRFVLAQDLTRVLWV